MSRFAVPQRAYAPPHARAPARPATGAPQQPSLAASTAATTGTPSGASTCKTAQRCVACDRSSCTIAVRVGPRPVGETVSGPDEKESFEFPFLHLGLRVARASSKRKTVKELERNRYFIKEKENTKLKRIHAASATTRHLSLLGTRTPHAAHGVRSCSVTSLPLRFSRTLRFAYGAVSRHERRPIASVGRLLASQIVRHG